VLFRKQRLRGRVEADTRGNTDVQPVARKENRPLSRDLLKKCPGEAVNSRWISRIGAPLIAFVLTVASSVSTAHAVEDARKVSVVSFGLFGDQGVFRSEAIGAARVVATRFGGAPINVQYNSKKGGGATIEGLAMSLWRPTGWTPTTTFCF
jgi:hypothetical protein